MFNFGLLTAILDGWTFEEAVDAAAEMGFECLEVACWPAGKAERRYAGVSHIDAERVCTDSAYAKYVTDYVASKGMHISSLAYYPNTMDPDLTKRAAAIGHLEALIRASAILGVNMVTTFIGRDQHKTVEENIELFKEIWPPIIRFAEEKGVKIAIENCPIFGLNFDPSHYVWQGLDYVQTVYEFKDKLFHIHFKDIKLYPEKLKQVGVLAYPLEYMSPQIPGLGDVDWGAFVSALNDIRYNGDAVIEVEDKAFESCKEDVLKSIRLSKRCLDNFII